MPLDPDVQAVLDGLRSQRAQPPHVLGAARAREQAARLAPPVITVLADESVEELDVACRSGNVRARLYRPSRTKEELPLAVYCHGGAWCLGDLDSCDAICRRISVRSQSAVLSVGYRLAPEHPFPAGLNDCWDVLLWARAHGPRLGIDTRRVAVVGDSAGGNLAAAVALRARDAGVDLRLQQLIYPVVDCDLDRPSYLRYATGFGLERATMAWAWAQYVPGPATRALPEASPLRAADLRGLARAHVLVMEYDVLRDEGVEYAELLRDAGVRVRLSEHGGLNHGVLQRLGVVRRADEVLTELTDELRRALRS